MIFMKNILKTVCTLETKNGECLTGYFYRPKHNLWFEYKSDENLDIKYPDGIPALCGIVNGIKMTVIGAQTQTTIHSKDEQMKEITSFTGQMFCDVAVFGLSTYDEIKIKQMSIDWFALSKFGVMSPWVFNKKTHNVYSDMSLVSPLLGKTDEHDLTVGVIDSAILTDAHILDNESSVSCSANLSPRYYVHMSFSKNNTLHEALRQMNSVQQLMCYFADYGVNYGNSGLSGKSGSRRRSVKALLLFTAATAARFCAIQCESGCALIVFLK
jgi:hypothetical protein